MNPLNNPAIGYTPFPSDDGITYADWCETFGKWRWRHQDGRARTYYPLEYNWPEIYDITCKYTDIAFAHRMVFDPISFTDEFLALVPEAWMKFKVELEMFSGTLDGTNIDPLMFEAGFTRDTESSGTNNVSGNYSGQNQNTGTSTMGSRTDTSSGNSRQLNYVQGVQGLEPTKQNIGSMGIGHASNIIDAVDDTEATIGTQTNTDVNSGTQSSENKSNANGTFKEHIHETRINYYDNLAFLREREDHLRFFKKFSDYFLPLFVEVNVKKSWW